MSCNLTECPKCFGSGEVPHKHIEDGVCFLCDRVGQVDEATANRWLAQQAHIPYVRSSKAPISTEHVAMDLDLGPVFGTCKIIHYYGDAPGQFVVRLGAIKDGELDEYGEPVGGFPVWFRTVRGRVTIDMENLVNGMRYYGHDRPGQLQRVLQTAIAA